MAHGPVVPQNFSSEYSYENDFSGVFDAWHQSFLVTFVMQYLFLRELEKTIFIFGRTN